MLPSGFKKDSRIWLHKNPKPRGDDVDKTAVLQRFLNSEREEEEGYNHVLESNGRQFKKDSRTWLHKSSQKKTQLQRRKGANPVAGDYCREAEFARSNTDVRLPFHDTLKRKCTTFHASQCDIVSNDHSMKHVLRKKRGDTALHNIAFRKPCRTLSDERLNDEIANIITNSGLSSFPERERATVLAELADDRNPAMTDEENGNQVARQCLSDPAGNVDYCLRSYPSLIMSDPWRETVGIKSDTSSSGHSKDSMDTLAPLNEDGYNANCKGTVQPSVPDELHFVAEKLDVCHSVNRSSLDLFRDEQAQLKMMALCASPPGSLCSAGSISEEDLRSSDIDI